MWTPTDDTSDIYWLSGYRDDASEAHWLVGYDDERSTELYDDYSRDAEAAKDVNFLTPAAEATDSHLCSGCAATFSSRNQLFKHLRGTCWLSKDISHASPVEPSPAEPSPVEPSPAEPSPAEPSSADPSSQAENRRRVIESAVTPNEASPGYAFRGYQYGKVPVRLGSNTKTIHICVDTGNPITMGGRRFIAEQLPDAAVQKLASPVPVRGVGGKVVKSDEYVRAKMSFDGVLNNKDIGSAQPATGVIDVEIYLIDDFAVNLLLGNDVIFSQGMKIDSEKRRLIIGKCEGIRVPLEVLSRFTSHIKRTIRSRQAYTLMPGDLMEVPVIYHGALPDDRDFLFESHCQYDLGYNGGVYAHVVDNSLSKVLVRNATTEPVTLARRARLGTVTEYNQTGCYLAMPEESHKAASGWMTGRSWKKQLAASFAIVAAAYAAVSSPQTSTGNAAASAVSLPVPAPSVIATAPAMPAAPQIDPSLEHVLPSGVTVYGKDVSGLASLVDSYQDIFKDSGSTVDIPEEEWMPINLKPGAAPKANKVYPLGARDRSVIDATFDKLHEQGKLHWTTQPTEFSYPAFVVWRDTPAGQKGRVVIDIRGLNDITESDSYPLPLQADVIAEVAGSPFISTIDAVGWFHQFNVQRKDRHKFTVVSHRGQEESSVALMGFKGSPPYVQRQTDKLLRPYKAFAKAYVDDIIVHSSTLQEHLTHLHTLFDMFRIKRINLAAIKTFLAYLSVTLLGQRVDSLGMSTTAEKIAAITSLRFPLSLRDLEIFMGLIGWLRSSIFRYAQRAQPLQERKTTLVKEVTTIGSARKRQAFKTYLYESTHEERAVFRDLQAAFAFFTFLVHYDKGRRLYVDLDAFKQWGFAAIVYHVLGDPPDGESCSRTAIQSIMFLSRCLNGAEKNYLPIELEVAGIVWVVRKIRHMIESTEVPPVIVYTDHSAAVPISRQTTLTTFSSDKLNLRLVRASQYLSGFNLFIRHKAGKANVVPDALSRLQADVPITEKVGVLESLYGHPLEPLHGDLAAETPLLYHHVTLVEMSDDFKQRLKQAYKDDEHWSTILAMVRPRNTAAANGQPATLETTESQQPDRQQPAAAATEAEPPPSPELETEHPLTGPRGLRFRHKDGLLYFISGIAGAERLCIPESMEAEVFRQAHDLTHHGGFMRTYDRLRHAVYIRSMVKHLKTYIAHCPECQINQTKRHPTYGELTPIVSPAIPFHTIAMDFIVALPLSRGMNVLLTITCKFTKRILLIAGHDTWDAVTWANVVLVALIDHDWGIPHATVSDRDSKFMSDFWRAVFSKLGVHFLTSTAWHPQTDGQSERTNQIIEIALRFHLTAHPEDEWVDVLPFLQAENNNVVHATTGHAPNELAYGFKVNDTLGLLADLPPEEYSQLRQIKREDAEAAMAFAGALSKARYDAVHKAVDIKVGDKVYLRLHQGYIISGLANHKLSNQRVGPFSVLEKIGNLAFRL